MTHEISEIDENIEPFEPTSHSRFRLPKGREKLEAESPEVVLECVGPWISGVQFAALRQQLSKHCRLVGVCLPDVNLHRLVMEVATVSLELRDKHKEEAPVELLGSPTTTSATATGVDMKLLEFFEAGCGGGVPLALGEGWHA